MQTPLEISFVDTAPSSAVDADVRKRAAKLEQFYDGITSCHVYIAEPHKHHRKGKQFEVRIEIRVPGTELAVSHRPGDDNAHEDIHVTVRDAFDAIERQLKDWKPKVTRGSVRDLPPGDAGLE